LPKILERRIERFQAVGQLGEDLEIGLGFAQGLDHLGPVDVVVPLVPGQGDIVAFEVGGDRQQHVGPDARGRDGRIQQTTSSSFLMASISLLMLVSWLNQSEPCQKMP
jgi:hypothetical protein